jgi:phosphoribosylaminoimidazole-succinocarboxamide synthase
MRDVELPGLAPWKRGKVRSVFEAGPEHLVIVASDRLSAYDSVLPEPIPGKGVILSTLSAWWMRGLAAAAPHHLVSDDPREFPDAFAAHAGRLEGRAQLVRRGRRVDVECVVRGYLTGSGLREYRRTGTVCGLPLPAGLADGARLEPARFTPTTKAEAGHDLPLRAEEAVDLVGAAVYEKVRDYSIAMYELGAARAQERGLVLADTKFEFGELDGEIIVIDEMMTPDSSRYWPLDAYEVGTSPPSFDKQFVRDFMDSTGWNHEPPAPRLPPDVIDATRGLYREAYEMLTGSSLDEWYGPDT